MEIGHREYAKKSHIFIYAIVLSIFVLIATKKIDDFDYWTHLHLGEYFFANLNKLSIYDLIFNSSNNGWPFQVFLHYLHEIGSNELVSIVFSLLLAGIFAPVFLFLTEKNRARFVFQIFLVTLTFSVCHYRAFPRPEIVAYLLFSVSLMLAVSWLDKPKYHKLLLLLAISLFWIPLHVTVFIGVPFVGALMLTAPGGWQRLQQLPGKIRGASIAAGFLLGSLGLYFSAKFAVFVFGELKSGGVLFGITEMRPTWEFPDVAFWYLGLVACCGLAVYQGAATRKRHLPLFFLLALLGTVVVRNVAIAAIGMLYLALIGLRDWSWPEAWGKRLRIVIFAALVAVMLGAGVNILFFRGQQWGAGVAKPYFPEEASRFVLTNGVPGPVFNNLDCGGYLLWAWQGKIPYFLDGRLGSKEKMEDHDRILNGEFLQPLIDKHGIKTFLLQPFYWNSGRIFPVVGRLLFSPDWHLVYAGDALVFVNHLSPGMSALPKSEGWSMISRFADAYEKVNANAPHLQFSRGVALLGLGRRDEARIAFRAGLQKHPELTNYYRMYLQY